MNYNIQPAYVPEHCNAWQDFYDTDKFPHWWYVNKDSKKMFIAIKQPRNGHQRKSFVQGSYCGIKKRYVKENLWSKKEDFKLPLYRIDELDKPASQRLLIRLDTMPLANSDRSQLGTAL